MRRFFGIARHRQLHACGPAWRRKPARYAIVFLSALLAPVAASAQDAAFCDTLGVAFAAAPDNFRPLRTERFDHALDSFESDMILPGFETCRVDALRPGFYCMARGLSDEQAEILSAESRRRLATCFPGIAPLDMLDERSPVARLVTDWAFPDGRRIRLVRRDYAQQPGSVYLYVR